MIMMMKKVDDDNGDDYDDNDFDEKGENDYKFFTLLIKTTTIDILNA